MEFWNLSFDFPIKGAVNKVINTPGECVIIDLNPDAFEGLRETVECGLGPKIVELTVYFFDDLYDCPGGFPILEAVFDDGDIEYLAEGDELFSDSELHALHLLDICADGSTVDWSMHLEKAALG